SHMPKSQYSYLRALDASLCRPAVPSHSRNPPGDRSISLQLLTAPESDWLEFVSADADRNRAVNQINRYHQTAIHVLGNQGSLNTVEGAAADAHALVYFQIGVRLDSEFLIEDQAYVFNLLVRDRSATSLAAHETGNARRAQD